MNGYIDLHDENTYLNGTRSHRIARIGALLLVLLILAGLILTVDSVPGPSAEIAGVGGMPADIDRHAHDDALAQDNGGRLPFPM